MKAYLDLAYGDSKQHERQCKAHDTVKRWLKKNGSSYGLPEDIDALDEVGKETLGELWSTVDVSS